MRFFWSGLVTAGFLLGGSGCSQSEGSGDPAADDAGSNDTGGEPASDDTGGDETGGGDPITPADPEPDPWLAKYAEVQAEAAQMDVDDFLSTYAPPPTVDALSYDPLQAVGLDAIEQEFPLSPEQVEVLSSSGFVAIDPKLPTFEHAYLSVYFADLPVLITTDSILYALHRSFDAILMQLELTALVPELEHMLREMHEGLQADVSGGALPASMDAAAQDLDVYLTVARRLLTDSPIAAATGAAADARADEIIAAVQAEAVRRLDLFGVPHDYDYSQMKPRGHYEDDPALQRYFRAMIWLGRTDMQLVHFPEQEPVFNRRGVEAAYLTRHLLDDTGAIARWQSIERVMRTMIGEPDSMNPADMPKLAQTLGISGPKDLAALSDQQIFDALVKGDYGVQRIMSQIMYTDPTDPPLILPRVHLLLGQRFTIDSYVFNNVTYDRVQDLRTGNKVTRMLPDELDVQFVLGNDEAAQLLEPQLQQYGYQGILHELRFLVDSHPPQFWDSSFYSGWLAGIRALNAPTQEQEQYPEPMRTEAWQHKTLSTQAASRAELRHDTLLYVKQSYSGGIGCEYPDGYVEPAAEFYARMEHLGELGQQLVTEIQNAGYEAPYASEYFLNWRKTMRILENIAHKELAGETLSGEEIAFLGMTIEEEIIGCGETAYDGWYPRLFFDPDTVAEAKPTIADVHTAPTDEAGNERGWIKHAATGSPALLVLTVPQCDGSSSAYIGPISSYYDVLTENYERMTDSEWAEELSQSPPALPQWTADFRP